MRVFDLTVSLEDLPKNYIDFLTLDEWTFGEFKNIKWLTLESFLELKLVFIKDLESTKYLLRADIASFDEDIGLEI